MDLRDGLILSLQKWKSFVKKINKATGSYIKKESTVRIGKNEQGPKWTVSKAIREVLVAFTGKDKLVLLKIECCLVK